MKPESQYFQKLQVKHSYLLHDRLSSCACLAPRSRTGDRRPAQHDVGLGPPKLKLRFALVQLLIKNPHIVT